MASNADSAYNCDTNLIIYVQDSLKQQLVKGEYPKQQQIVYTGGWYVIILTVHMLPNTTKNIYMPFIDPG